MSANNQPQARKPDFNHKAGAFMGHVIAATLAMPIAFVLIVFKMSWKVIVFPLLKRVAVSIAAAVQKRANSTSTVKSKAVQAINLGLPTPACFQGHANLAPAKEFRW